MRIYNTLTRRIEDVEPRQPGAISMYTCGPTVYRNIHIGNLRTFCMADWLRRGLEYEGFRVTQVKNITDVGHMRQELLDRGEDKLVAQARAEGKTSAQIAAFYTEAFHRDEQALHIQPAHIFPKATDHISEMIAIVRELVAREFAYELDGNIFYDVTRFPRYGQLSGNQLARSLEALRGEISALKRHPEDFPLWKRAEPGREMAWDSPWGRGFPGWHIECSAMAIKHLGPSIDIHTGGVDNIFPHHEDEIAQSEAYTDQPFARYWVHAQHLLSDGQKMAKSTGNSYILDDVIARGFSAQALRYLFATAHYRARTNFTFTALKAAEVGLRRLSLAARQLAAESAGAHSVSDGACMDEYRRRFRRAIGDDLNIPRALAIIWSLARGRMDGLSGGERLALLLEFDGVIGLQLREAAAADNPAAPGGVDGSDVPEAVLLDVDQRAVLRARGDYEGADRLRQLIAAAGYRVDDTRGGPVVAPRAADDGLWTISRSTDVVDRAAEPAHYEFSVHLVARNSRSDLERCLRGIALHRGRRSLEVVIVDNGSTDDTLPFLRDLARAGIMGEGEAATPVRVIFADHDLGFAAARNASTRAGLGAYVVQMDTSIEVAGDIWSPLERLLADSSVGVVGPYALVTDDLKEFRETAGPFADAIEGYLFAFRRELQLEVGPAEEKFRFYRLLDIYMSFMFKTSGYSVVRSPEVEDRIIKHPHREWYSLSEEDRASRSKKNYDLFRRRWHHGETLLTARFAAGSYWPGHDHAHHVGGTHGHTAVELPEPGTVHSHDHRHWPDHSHAHSHVHALARSGEG